MRDSNSLPTSREEGKTIFIARASNRKQISTAVIHALVAGALKPPWAIRP